MSLGYNVGMETLTKEEAAAEIAHYDYEVDETTQAFYRILAADEDDAQEPLKLLKVNADTPPLGILPLHFPAGGSDGIPFSYELAVVTPDEFREIATGRLPLPSEWRLGRIIENPRPRSEEAVA